MPDPKNGPIGKDNPFPTVGMYNEKKNIFCPMPLYTRFLEKVVYHGIATVLPNQHLLYLRCNSLSSYIGQKRSNFANGTHHVDFNVDNQNKWKDK